MLPKLKRVELRDFWDKVHPKHKGHDLRALPAIDTSIRAVCLTCLPDDWNPGDGFGQGDEFETLVITHVQYLQVWGERNKESE